MIVIEPLGDLGRTYRYAGRTVSRQASAAEIAKIREAATARRLRTRRYGIRTLSTRQRRSRIARAEQARGATSTSRAARRRSTTRRRTTPTRRRTRTRTRRRVRARPSAAAASRASAAAASRARAARARSRRVRVSYTRSPSDPMIQQAINEVMTATGLKGGEQITDISAFNRMVTARVQALTQSTRRIARGKHIAAAIANRNISEPWEMRAAKMRPHVRATEEMKLKQKFFRRGARSIDVPNYNKMVTIAYGGQPMPHWSDYFSGRLTDKQLEDRIKADYQAEIERQTAIRAAYRAAFNAWDEGGQIGPRPVKTF